MEIEITERIVINCPEKAFELRLAKHCPACEFFGGYQATNGDSAKAEECFVICNRPITRRMIKIEVE